MQEATAVAERDSRLQDTGERIIPQHARDTIDYAEHMARYLFAARFVPGRRVLDIACGVGYGSKILAESDPTTTVTGIDLSEQAVEYARRHHPAVNLRYMVGSAAELPFEPEGFDLVIAFEFIEHIAEQQSFLREAKRVLHPEGQLIISTPNRWMSVGHNPFHIRELGDNEFHAMLRDQFAHVTLFYQSNVLASVLKSATCLPSLKPDRPGFSAIVGDPFTPEEAIFLVAVCSDRPPAQTQLPFEAGVCVTRNDEYHKIRNILDERGRALGVEVERTLRSEQLIQALRMQVNILELRLAERERQNASLEEQLVRQSTALQQSAASIESRALDLDRTVRECRATIEALRPLLEQKPESLELQRESLDHSWNTKLDVIRQALESL